MKQLTIFDVPLHEGVVDLPRAIAPVDPKVEAVLEQFAELKSLEVKPEFVAGCIVRSSTAFKGKTAKFLRTEQICSVKFAVVQLEFRGSLIEYKCNLESLEVVE